MEIAGVQLEELDVTTIGSWPMQIRHICFGLILSATLIVGYVYDLNDQWARVTQETDIEEKARENFRRRHHEVSNLAAYRTQMQTVRQTFNVLKNQLPQAYKGEELLEELSQKASASRLEFITIKPASEQSKGFYTEYPIEVVLSGNSYHRFGEFMSDLAAMSRIVTLHDFLMQRVSKPSGGQKSGEPALGSLTMEVTLRTYTYSAEEKKS